MTIKSASYDVFYRDKRFIVRNFTIFISQSR